MRDTEGQTLVVPSWGCRPGAVRLDQHVHHEHLLTAFAALAFPTGEYLSERLSLGFTEFEGVMWAI